MIRTLSRPVVLLLALLLASAAVAQNVGVSKSGPSQATAGSTVVYTVTVYSNGVTFDPNTSMDVPADATNVVLNDNIPEGMTFVSLSQDTGPAFSCSTPAPGSGGSITCNIATLPSGQSAQFSFGMEIPPQTPDGTTYTNIATVTADVNSLDEDDSAAAATSTPTTSADVGVTKNGPGSAAPNTDVTYTITVTSNGPATAQNVTLNDTLPGNMTFVSLSQSGQTFSCSTPAVGSGGAVTCTDASMPPGTSTTFTLVGHIPNTATSGTTYENTASVTSANDPTSENDSASTQLTVSSADAGVVKSGPPTATAGQNITYSLTLSNSGPDFASDASFTDALPAGTKFVSLVQNTGSTATCTTPGSGGTGTVGCSIGLMAPATTATFTLVLSIDPTFVNGATLTNTATASTSSYDTNGSNNSSSTSAVVIGVTDIGVTKTAPASATSGSPITYTITVTNNGTNAAASTTLTDTLPAGTTFVSLNQTSGPAFTCSTGATISCSLASFAGGSTAVFSLVVNTASSATGTISNTASVATTTGETSTANNSSTASTLLTQSADVSVTKNGPTLITQNTDVTYTINVTNAGPSDAQSITLTDVTPANTTFVSASGSGFSCGTPAAGATGTVSCTMPSLASGATAQLTLVVHASSSFVGTISNTANVSSTTPDPNATNNTATSSAPVATADVSIAKNGPALLAPNTDVTYTVTVSNAGPNTAQSISVIDAVPANTTFVSASGAGFSCSNPAVGGTGTITCTMPSMASGGSATLTIVVHTAAAFGGTITNTATVSSTTPDPNPANNTASSSGSQTVADLAITKTPATAPSGTTGAFTITVTNNGPSTASTVTMTDTVPANATFASVTQTSGPTFTCTPLAPGATGTFTCTIGTLTAGQSATFNVVFNGINQVAQITNTATVSSTTVDPNPANNTATATTYILLFVPALSPLMLALLALAFTAIGAMILRR